LKARYDVRQIIEDDWHAFAGKRTQVILENHLKRTAIRGLSHWLLNAGAGVYSLQHPGWKELAVDLFPAPISGRPNAICADIQRLPIASSVLGGIACTGEVIGYCDPVTVIKEFSRVLQPGGLLAMDFSSTKGFRHLFRPSFGRAADILDDEYNGSSEKVWAYDPSYICHLLTSGGFKVKASIGTHRMSGFLRRFGFSVRTALRWEERTRRWTIINHFADIITIVAIRSLSLPEQP
jgi:SAM-dependent methyltransferase